MPNLTVNGNAKHFNQEPVQNATVKIYELGGKLITTIKTNEKGEFEKTTNKWSGSLPLTFIIEQTGRSQNGPYLNPFLSLPIIVPWGPPGTSGGGTSSGGGLFGSFPMPSLPIDTSFFISMLSQLFPGGVLDLNTRNSPNFPEKFGDISATVEWIGLQHTIPVVPIILGRNNEVTIDVAEWINDINGCCSDEGVAATVDWIGTQHTIPIIPIVIGEGNQISIKAPHRLDTNRNIPANADKLKTHE
ncbi:MAG: hypothetical protein KC445_13275 [Anaerolineales bacterium]|nr:hypothetical protein [Anaerolineales bacterium]